MQPLINIGIKAAREAGDFIIKAGERLDLISVSGKQQHDYVTNVDQSAENIIINVIRDHYPNHGILAEESGTLNHQDDVVWIIDPLDGTKNFIHGIPHYAVSIGIKQKKQLVGAIIYNPCQQELFIAERGRGARLNDSRIRVSSRANLSGSLLGTALPFKARHRTPMQMELIDTIYPHITDIRRSGSAALDLAYVAAGRLDGYWEMGLAPWDMAAGILLVREAGGVIVDLQGGENYQTSGDIVAANPRVLKHLIKLIAPVCTAKS